MTVLGIVIRLTGMATPPDLAPSHITATPNDYRFGRPNSRHPLLRNVIPQFVRGTCRGTVCGSGPLDRPGDDVVGPGDDVTGPGGDGERPGDNQEGPAQQTIRRSLGVA
jgi:hypothetical protein